MGNSPSLQGSSPSSSSPMGWKHQEAVKWSHTATVYRTITTLNNKKPNWHQTLSWASHVPRCNKGEPQLFMFTEAPRLFKLLLGKFPWPAKPPHNLWFILRRGSADEVHSEALRCRCRSLPGFLLCLLLHHFAPPSVNRFVLLQITPFCLFCWQSKREGF